MYAIYRFENISRFFFLENFKQETNDAADYDLQVRNKNGESVLFIHHHIATEVWARNKNIGCRSMFA